MPTRRRTVPPVEQKVLLGCSGIRLYSQRGADCLGTALPLTEYARTLAGYDRGSSGSPRAPLFLYCHVPLEPLHASQVPALEPTSLAVKLLGRPRGTHSPHQRVAPSLLLLHR